MSEKFDEDLLNGLLFRLNNCIHEDIKRSYEDEAERADALKDFKKCCKQKEKLLLKKAINHAIENNSTMDKDAVYIAVLYYYYYTIVLEYYLTDMCMIKNFITNLYYPRIKSTVEEKTDAVEKLVMKIASSDESWASHIRRVLNNWDKLTSFSNSVNSSNGGKKRKTVRRKKNKNKSKKLKRKIK
jgi:hypothetical protein